MPPKLEARQVTGWSFVYSWQTNTLQKKEKIYETKELRQSWNTRVWDMSPLFAVVNISIFSAISVCKFHCININENSPPNNSTKHSPYHHNTSNTTKKYDHRAQSNWYQFSLSSKLIAKNGAFKWHNTTSSVRVINFHSHTRKSYSKQYCRNKKKHKKEQQHEVVYSAVNNWLKRTG